MAAREGLNLSRQSSCFSRIHRKIGAADAAPDCSARFWMTPGPHHAGDISAAKPDNTAISLSCSVAPKVSPV